MILYIAGAYESRPRLAKERTALVARCPHVAVCSSWLDEPDSANATRTDYEEGRLLQGYAIRDLHEVRLANVLILDTIDAPGRGGRDFEAGYAMALGKVVLRVGPPRNVFHRLLPGYFEWKEVRLGE